MSDRSSSARSRREALGAAVLFALLAAAFVAPALERGMTLLPSDLAFQYDHAWTGQAGAATAVAQNPILADVSDYYYPYRVHTLEQLRHGRIPLWNPLILAGTPFFASAQAALLDPVTAISLLAGRFDSWSLGAWLRLALLGGFAYGLARGLGRTPLAAVAAGVVFMICGFVTVWLNYPVVTSLVWMPALLWAALRLAETGRRRALAGVAASIGLLLVGGHPETQFLVGLFFVAFCIRAVSLLPAGLRLDRIAKLAVGVVLGGALGAAQWVPFVQFLFQSHAFADRAEPFVGFDAAETGLRLAMLLLPKLGGTRLEVDYWLPSWTNFIEQTGYVGLLAIALAALGVAAARRNGGADARWSTFFGVVALLMTAFAVRAPGFHFVKLLPLFDVGHGVRWVLVASLCVALLAARGVDVVRGAPVDRDRMRRAGLWCVACALLGAVAIVAVASALDGRSLLALETRGAITAVDAGVVRGILRSGPRGVAAPLAFLIAGAFALLAAARLRRPTRVPALALCTLLYADLWVFGHRFNPVTPHTEVFPETPALRYVVEHAARERIVAAGHTLRPNVAMVFGLRDLRGYEDLVEGEFARIYQPTLERLEEERWMPSPALTPEEERLLQIGSVRFLLTPAPLATPGSYRLAMARAGLHVYENRATLPRAYTVLGARFAPDADTVRSLLLAPDFDPFTAVILTGDGVPTSPSAGSPVRWLEDEPESVEIETTLPAPGYLVLTDRHAPEWEARVNGAPAPILRANGAFRAVALPTGTHRVHFTYRPRLVVVCAAVSGIALLATLAIAAAPGRRRSAASGAAR